MKSTKNIRVRYNLLTVFVYVIGILLLLSLFNLQIIHGSEYRQQSNVRLTRESTLEAARGNILDKYGNIIASSQMGFRLELYKTKLDVQDLNLTILNTIRVLEQNGDRYIDTFPISIDPFAFQFSSEERLAKWKSDNKIPDTADAEEAFTLFKEKYKIENDNLEETRKVIGIRYEISQKGYSSVRPIEIASNISRSSAMIFQEQSAHFPGLSVVTKPIRTYDEGTLASHIIGYVARINDKELETRKDTYGANDMIGKTGIEYAFEEYLKGQNGIKQIDMSIDGTVVDEYIEKEAVSRQ